MSPNAGLRATPDGSPTDGDDRTRTGFVRPRPNWPAYASGMRSASEKYEETANGVGDHDGEEGILGSDCSAPVEQLDGSVMGRDHAAHVAGDDGAGLNESDRSH